MLPPPAELERLADSGDTLALRKHFLALWEYFLDECNGDRNKAMALLFYKASFAREAEAGTNIRMFFAYRMGLYDRYTETPTQRKGRIQKAEALREQQAQQMMEETKKRLLAKGITVNDPEDDEEDDDATSRRKRAARRAKLGIAEDNNTGVYFVDDDSDNDVIVISDSDDD